MRQHIYYVYVVASPSRTISTGVTNDLERRLWQHTTKIIRGVTADQGATRLARFAEYRMINDAIAREKQVEGRHRERGSR